MSFSKFTFFKKNFYPSFLGRGNQDVHVVFRGGIQNVHVCSHGGGGVKVPEKHVRVVC